MATFFLVVGAVIIAVAVSTLANRSTTSTNAELEHHIPDQIDGADFCRTLGSRMLVVFSSSKCNTCALVIEAVSRIDKPSLVVVVADIETKPDLHAKYNIEAVPTTLLAEPSGRVVKSFLGPVGRELIEQALSDAWPESGSGNV